MSEHEPGESPKQDINPDDTDQLEAEELGEQTGLRTSASLPDEGWVGDLSVLSPDELVDYANVHADAVKELLEPQRSELAEEVWAELGPDGLLTLFRQCKSHELEHYLRDHKAPAPRRPGPPDAFLVFRQVKTRGVKSIVRSLKFLGGDLAADAFDLFDRGDMEELGHWRIQVSDPVIRGALLGQVLSSSRSSARAVATLNWMNLLPSAMVGQPDICRHSSAVEQAIAELHSRRDDETQPEDQSRTELAEAAQPLLEGGKGIAEPDVPGLDITLPHPQDQGPAPGASPPAPDVTAALNAANVLRDLLATFPDLRVRSGLAIDALGTIEDALGAALRSHNEATDRTVPRVAELEGPEVLEDVLTLLRDGARNSDPSLTKFLSALEALIDAAADPEADPYTLDALEAEARSLDTGGQFSAVLTSAVRGALRLPEVPTESADSSPSAAPQDTAAPLELSTAAKFEESADLVDAPVEEMIENVTRESTSATAVSRGRPVQSEPVETDANKATWAAAELTSRYEGQIASAIDDGYFGIAAWMASALGSPDALLHTTVLARALRNPKGPVSNTLVDAYVALSETGISGGRHVKLVAWAASLQAALVAPETGIAQLAVELAPMLDLDGAEDLTAAVLQCALRGVSLAGAALSAVGDLASLDEEVARRSASVQTALQTRRYRYAVASAVWTEWTERGVLVPLAPAATDNRDLVDPVRAACEKLQEKRTLERELGAAEKRIRMKSSTKRTEGSAKHQLIGHATDAVDAALSWCDAVDALVLRQRGASSGAEEVATALREVAGRVKSVVYTSIERGGTGAKGARLILDDVYALMSGTSLAGSELAPALAHSKSLLYGDQPLDSRLEPLLPLDPDAVLAGRYRNLEQAFAYRLDRDDYVGAKALLEIAQVSNPDTASSLQPLYLEALLPARARVRALGEQTAATLDRARRQLYVTEDDYAKLSGRLARSIDPERLDVDREMADLMNMANELSANKDRAIERFLSAPVVADLRANNVEFARRVDALIGEGDLATATELVQLAERGEDLAGADRDSFDISSFFPVVPDALVSGINAAMVDAARKRRTFGLLDFSKLNEDAAEQVGKALAAWRAFSSGNGISDMLGTLKPVLRLLGIEAGAEDRRALLGVTSSPQRRWFDLSGVVVTGKALLPFFGSQSMGRLRCLRVTGSPAAETLTEWIEQDLARVPVVVFHTGTMTAESRLAFTRTMRKREGRPVVVVDDAVVGWLASLGQFRFEPLMQATLPFSAGNPYLPPSGDCPVELFYGRAAHVAAVQAAAGTCLVYGGRQLGKSALLRTAQREFNRVANQVAVYIDLKAPIESSRNPEAVWAELATKLVDARVMEQPRGVLRDPAGRVTSAVTDWLDEDETRRLLVLLDEADLYFDLDAQRNFVTTSRLKDLMDTRGRRFKVVWAGLHQVGRFATVSNHPIAHLGAPAVIGPLEPGPAYRLIEVPCAALGLQFESDALVNRILAYCNYQPVLLHLFGRALVQRLCMRSSSDLDSLPITVSEAEIEEIAGSAALQQAVRERLRLTLELDPRYKVITYSAAYEAHIRGFDIALSASELRAASERWWAAGFAGVDASEFRSLLEELVGLGVLSADPDGGGWRLRSANVLRLLGTLEQVEDSLLEEEEREPTALESSEIRDYLGGAHSSPITRAQLADLMGTRANQVRLVVGSAATGADNLHEALVQAATSPPVRFTLSAPRKRAEFMRALEDGGTEHHRVVFSDLRTVNPETCAESLEAALAITPWIGSRSVILLVDARTIAWWMPYLAPDNHAPGLEVMSLRRFDRRSLRAWSSGHEAVFQDEESRSKLLALTGGWPALIERASGLAGEGRTTTAVLTELEAIIQSDASIDKLLVATMKSVPPPLSDLYTIMAEAPEVAMSADDLALVAEGTYADARILVEAMRALQVISVTEQGELVAEPVMARAWLARGQAERDIDTGV